MLKRCNPLPLKWGESDLDLEIIKQESETFISIGFYLSIQFEIKTMEIPSNMQKTQIN